MAAMQTDACLRTPSINAFMITYICQYIPAIYYSTQVISLYITYCSNKCDTKRY